MNNTDKQPAMGNNIIEKTPPYCLSTTEYSRRHGGEVRIGTVAIGGSNPIAVQSMTDRDTNDTAACVEQAGRIRLAGGRIVRLTAQGVREAENLGNIAAEVKRQWPDMALVADIHFLPKAACVAAGHVDKVRINPGNYNDRGGDFRALLEKCSSRGVALRIGVNHGSLSERIVAEYGDTPCGMVVAAMEFLRECRANGFDQVVVSMKSSNTRVMVHAYRLLAAAMMREGMDFPIHLGVTEAGNGAEGRIKSAVGIGAMLADGIGDTIRVSLTEPPENEIPVAATLVNYFADREERFTEKEERSAVGETTGKRSADGKIVTERFADRKASVIRGREPKSNMPSEQNVPSGLNVPSKQNIPLEQSVSSELNTSSERNAAFDPYRYARRKTNAVGRLGGNNVPLLYSELSREEIQSLDRGEVALLTASSRNPVQEWRRMIMEMDAVMDRRPVIMHRRYAETSAETLMIKAAADFGVMFIDGLADGIYIENRHNGNELHGGESYYGRESLKADGDKADYVRGGAAGAECERGSRLEDCVQDNAKDSGSDNSDNSQDLIDSIALGILQASRARISKPDYIACPGCGRTLFDLHGVLNQIKARTSHLKRVKIAVMGCIVNGPGEMADADYGYVGAAPEHITLYRGKDQVRRNIPQDQAIEALVELLKADGIWEI